MVGLDVGTLKPAAFVACLICGLNFPFSGTASCNTPSLCANTISHVRACWPGGLNVLLHSQGRMKRGMQMPGPQKIK